MTLNYRIGFQTVWSAYSLRLTMKLLKFKKIYSPEEVGKYLKLLLERMQSSKEISTENKNDFVSFTDDNGDFKSTEQILREISDKWEEATYDTSRTT